MSILLRNIIKKSNTLTKILLTRNCTKSVEIIQSELNAPGLSGAVYEMPTKVVGPGASKDSDYKNPEYFAYHKVSYFEAEIELAKYRCPQPSALKKE